MSSGKIGCCRNPACPDYGKRLMLYKNGLCKDCWIEAQALIDPLAMRDCPETGRDEMPAAAAIQGDAEAFSGRETPTGASPILDPQESAELVAALARTPGVEIVTDTTLPDLTQGPIEPPFSLGTTRQVVAAAIDTSQPFVLAGIEFQPVRPKRPMGSCSICIRRETIGISMAAEQQLGLQPYSHASYTVSLDGQAVAIMFYSSPRDEAVTVQRNKGALSISSVPLGREHPELVGKRTALQPTEAPGCFIARFGGEAA